MLVQANTCKRCGKVCRTLTESREKGIFVCEECYARESMETLGIGSREQENILASMHRNRRRVEPHRFEGRFAIV